MLLNLLEAHLVGALLLGPVFGDNALILGRCPTQNLAQRGHHFLLGNAVIAPGADAELRAPGGVDDYMVAHVVHGPIGVKEIYLLSGAELDVHHFHRLDLFFHVVLLI